MLNAQQRRMVNSVQWVVNAVLKRLKQENNEDMRQNGRLYLCRCVLRFDETRGVQWSTYAYSCVFLYIKRMLRRQQKIDSRIIATADINNIVDEKRYEEQIQANIVLDRIRKLLTKRELEYLEKRLERKTYNDIMRECNMDLNEQKNLWRNIKRKAKNEY